MSKSNELEDYERLIPILDKKAKKALSAIGPHYSELPERSVELMMAGKDVICSICRACIESTEDGYYSEERRVWRCVDCQAKGVFDGTW